MSRLPRIKILISALPGRDREGAVINSTTRRFSLALCILAIAAALFAADRQAPKFFPDDPLHAVPPPLPLDPAKVNSRKLSDYYDFFSNLLVDLGENATAQNPIPAGGVNTLGEVMDSEWFTNRHGVRRMSIEELRQGPRSDQGPPASGNWQVVGAKTEGVTPGFTIKDSRGVTYVIKFDPAANPEIGTSVDVIGSKFFHAIGYNVPENYIVSFDPEDLTVAPEATIRDADGKKRPMGREDLYFLLERIPWRPGQKVRASASLYLSGKPLGPFRFYGTRADDPNDIVPHEHRRDLRGYSVFCAWLDHDDSRAVNTLDMLVNEGGKHFIRHYLIDFGSILGSASNRPNSPRSGFEYLFDWKPAAIQFFTLGLYVPPHGWADYPDIPSVGRFEYELFDPLKWVPEYPNTAFENRLPEDGYWGAKIVMTFTDDEIRALVETGQYSDPAATDFLTKALIVRRDKIGRAFFSLVLPLDNFGVRDGQLTFEDLGVKYGFAQPRTYSWGWFRLDNQTGARTPIPGSGPAIPDPIANSPNGAYVGATVHADEPQMRVTVYLRRQNELWEIAGLERTPKEPGPAR